METPAGSTPPEIATASRRRVLVALALAGIALGRTALAQPTVRAGLRCALTPDQTEGPYFVDDRLNRSDVRIDPVDNRVTRGAPLTLDLGVAALDGTRCVPVAGAIVDIWQCDATGVYSGTDAPRADTRRSRLLRGFQITNAEGRVRFTTIYPGAYPGRAVHIHFKVRTVRGDAFTSQLYFDDALTDQVHATAPYTALPSTRTRNRQDGLYRAGGRDLQLDVRPTGDGFAAAYDIGVARG